MKRLLLLPLLALLCMQACKKDEPAGDQPKPEEAAKPVDYFFPMKVGNYWVYETVNSIGGGSIIDTIKVIGDIVINGKTFYRFNKLIPVMQLYGNSHLITDSSGYLVDTVGGIYEVNDGTRDSIGGEDYISVQTVIKTGNRDTLITISLGSFSSLETITDVYYESGIAPGSNPNPRPMYEYWAKNVGLVKRTLFYSGNPHHQIITLKSYHLEP